MAYSLPTTRRTESSWLAMAPLIANRSCGALEPRATPALPTGQPCRLRRRRVHARPRGRRRRLCPPPARPSLVRNTGHDFNGPSTGAGALAVWTHHGKGAAVVDRAAHDGRHVGTALGSAHAPAASGSSFFFFAAGLVAAAGECPGLGLAGGYTQGSLQSLCEALSTRPTRQQPPRPLQRHGGASLDASRFGR